jgi:hypothetical protein
MMLACATPCTFRLDAGVRDPSRLRCEAQCRSYRSGDTASTVNLMWHGERLMLENGPAASLRLDFRRRRHLDFRRRHSVIARTFGISPALRRYGRARSFLVGRRNFGECRAIADNPDEQAQYPRKMHMRRQGPSSDQIFCHGGSLLNGNIRRITEPIFKVCEFLHTQSRPKPASLSKLTVQKPNPHRFLNRLDLNYSLNRGTTEF